MSHYYHRYPFTCGPINPPFRNDTGTYGHPHCIPVSKFIFLPSQQPFTLVPGCASNTLRIGSSYILRTSFTIPPHMDTSAKFSTVKQAKKNIYQSVFQTLHLVWPPSYQLPSHHIIIFVPYYCFPLHSLSNMFLVVTLTPIYLP